MRFARNFWDARAAEALLDLNKGLKRKHPCPPIAAHFMQKKSNRGLMVRGRPLDYSRLDDAFGEPCPARLAVGP